MTTFAAMLLLFIISTISIGVDAACRSSYIPCEDGSNCIAKDAICNGFSNCKEGTDERNCENYTCLPTHTKCVNNIQCVRKDRFCDIHRNCHDHSDERDCDYCASHNPCVHGECITNRDGRLSCNCTGTGYNDRTCSTDNCVSSNPCINGVCINNGDGTLSCDCSGTGYTGSLCNTIPVVPKARRKDVSPQTASEQTASPSVNTQHEPTATDTARQSELTDTSAAPGATHNLPPGKTERVESKPDTGKSSVSLETVVLVAVGVAAVFVSFLGVALMAGNIFTSVKSAEDTAAIEANKANTASEDKNAREKITNPLGDSRESKSSETSLAITEPAQTAQSNDTTVVDLSADQSKHK